MTKNQIILSYLYDLQEKINDNNINELINLFEMLVIEQRGASLGI